MDTSAYLDYHFWQEVFVERPSGGEELGRWCGPTLKIGDTFTYFVLLNESKQLVAHSNVRPAKDALFPNHKARPSPSDGDTSHPVSKPVVTSTSDYYDEPLNVPVFSPKELLGLSFLHDNEDGQTVRAKVVQQIMDQDATNHKDLKFLLSLGDGELEEIISYNELSDLVTEQCSQPLDADNDMFGFTGVLDHQGPLKSHNPQYKGSSWNALISWDDGTETWEPINMIGKSDPVSLACYALDNDMLQKPGWKFLRHTARCLCFVNVELNAAKHRADPRQVRYKLGVHVPRNYKEAMELDRINGNMLWAHAIRRALDQTMDYRVFRDLGLGAPPPPGYLRIPLQLVFDVKSDGKRKARLVARGDRTPEPEESVYSSVASLHSLRVVTFVAELNNLNLMQGDIGNAYLESKTLEKVYYVTGPEFGPLEGHTFIIVKALYGLWSSGLWYHEKFAETMHTLRFFQSFTDPDVWMRDASDVYEYLVVYVDDLFAVMKDAQGFFDALQTDPWNYKLKGVGDPKYHLGSDFFRDNDGTLCMGAQTYVKRFLLNYELLFGELPKMVFSPIDHEDHPKLDNTMPCGPEDTTKFQSLIGACQWMISLCRFDLAQAVMSLGRFCNAPKQGHLERLKQVCGYIRKFPHAAI